MNYEWQEKFLNSDNEKSMLCCEAGTGKSHTAGNWLRLGNRGERPVVFCPKQIVKDWQERGGTMDVFTPQTILKQSLPEKPSAIVVDEADAFASPLFIAKKRSKCAAKLYEYIRANPNVPVLILTATPVRSTPWNLHTLLCYLGRYIKYTEWRDEYFECRPPYYGARPAWLPKPGWQLAMQEVIEEHATVALMKDMVDELPPETYEIIKLKAPNYEKNVEWEASKQFVEDHRLEQRGKDKSIEKIARGFRKVVVVAHYRDQIDELEEKLAKKRQTFVLDGRTKDAQRVIKDAEASSECYFIIQASVGAGFEVPSFSCMVFASQGYSVRNFVQMKARIRRINALKPVIYYHLLAGRCDKMVYDSIELGKDFVPSEYLSTTST